MKEHENNIQFQNFCHNIKWLRNENEYSKSKMAKMLGISVKTLEKLENGEMPNKLSVKVISNVKYHFNLHPVEQFGKRLGK